MFLIHALALSNAQAGVVYLNNINVTTEVNEIIDVLCRDGGGALEIADSDFDGDVDAQANSLLRVRCRVYKSPYNYYFWTEAKGFVRKLIPTVDEACREWVRNNRPSDDPLGVSYIGITPRIEFDWYYGSGAAYRVRARCIYDD